MYYQAEQSALWNSVSIYMSDMVHYIYYYVARTGFMKSYLCFALFLPLVYIFSLLDPIPVLLKIFYKILLCTYPVDNSILDEVHITIKHIE